jgi:thiol-disulfide isomerase/thioredoxin
MADKHSLYDTVTYLEDSDWDGQKFNTKDNKFLVMIYASWCGHCINAIPEYQVVGNKLKSGVYAIQADDARSKKLASKMKDIVGPKFGGFPTFCLFVDGRHSKTYSGERKAGPLIEFMNAPPQ